METAFALSASTSGAAPYSVEPWCIAGDHLKPAISPPKWLQGRLDAEWELVVPVVLHVEQDEDGEFIATDDFSTVYGNGRTPEEAITDYRQSLISYYEVLESHERDNEPTARLLRRLGRYLRRTHT